MSASSLSPCVRICVLDPELGWCRGCARTLAEIANWSSFSEEKRADLMRELPERRGARGSEPR